MKFSLKTLRAFLSLLILTALLLAPATVLQAQSAAPLDMAAVDSYLQAQMAQYHIPGMAVAVVQDDQVVLLKGYGDAGHGRSVTPQSQFYIGSLTKSFTALGIMQLVEEGKIDLDAPVQRYLPWFKVADPEASATITVRNLLNQTSGLSDQGDPGASDYAPTLTKEVEDLQYARLTAAPGTQFQYFNQNYRTLGLLIETISGQPYADYLRDHILSPLQMHNTTADPAQITNLAQGNGQAFGLPLPRTQEFRPGALPSGYLISSAEDLSHYLIAMLHETRYAEQTLVQPATLEQMFTPPSGIDSQYGMGWLIVEEEGEKIVLHGGAVENYTSQFFMLPDRQIGFAVLINQNGLYQMETGHTAIQNGLLNLLTGSPAPAGPNLSWVLGILIAVVLLDLANHLRLFWQLPDWHRKTARQTPTWKWIKTVGSLIIPAALLIGLPMLLGLAMGDSGGDWNDVYGIAPDLAVWLIVTLALSTLRGTIQLYLISRPAKAPIF